MQQAVLHHFPDAMATYRFTHRDKDVFFTRESVEEFKTVVSRKCTALSYLTWTHSIAAMNRIFYDIRHEFRVGMAETNLPLS